MIRWPRARRSDAPGAACAELIAAVCADLETINQSTERDFLRVGEKLASFLEQAGQVSGRAEALAAFLSGEDADRAGRELNSILDRSRRLAVETGAGRLALDRMLAGVTALAAPLAGLNRDMRTFRVLATLIRIENARFQHTGADFEALAQEVRKLALDIEQNSAILLSVAGGLGALVRDAMPGIAEFERRQQQELPRIHTRTAASLRELAEGRERAAAVSRRMAEDHAAAQREIGELVTSLQFHDLTRQQIEHVVKALAEAAREGPGTALLAEICGLQRAQLEQSRAVFETAVERVRASLSGIARNVSGMTDEIARLIEGPIDGPAGAQSSALAELSEGFNGIRSALVRYAESRGSLSMVARTVADGVEKMARFIDTIEEIGIRMQRIALNANVKSAQMGGDGVALAAVADGIQRLAADSRGLAEAVARGIRDVAEQSRGLSRELAQSSADLAAELEQTVAAFQSADSESSRRLAGIVELSRSLSSQLQTLHAGIQADRLLAEAVERSMEKLARVVELAGQADRNQPDHPAQLEAWRRIQERYSMHAERVIHAQAGLGEPAAAAVCESVTQPEPAPSGEFGANVELF